MDNNLTTDEVFESAVSIVRNLPKEGPIKPSDDLKLKLYAYYKQATHGPNDTAKPRFYQIVEAYKWDAWRKLGDMSKETAMLNYITELKQVMDSIPSESASSEDSKHFEDVLGKKFYDYWFQEWGRSGNRTQQLLASVAREEPEQRMPSRGNDTHSNSSGGSSMSMLEETQSAGDGYKTPSSLVFRESLAGEVSDQFASALLRLQHGLDENTSRLDSMEVQLGKALDYIGLLERQVQAGGRRPERTPHRPRNLLSNIKTKHWFYLSYPILVCLLVRAFERRAKNSSR